MPKEPSVQPELNDYLEVLQRRGHLSQADLWELEDHLFTALEAGLACGLDEESARAAALNSLGPTAQLATEYKKEHSMNPLSRLVGIAIALGAIALVTAPVGYLSTLFDLPSILLVAGVVIGGLVASFGPRALLRTLRQALASSPQPDRNVEVGLRVAVHGRRLSWAGGALGSILGVIAMLSNLSDPSEVGPGLALCLLSLFYGAVAAELFFTNLSEWLQAGGESPVAA